ncbi:class I adenylate-forming enzyme family protein [Parahaliea mediterranea]|uniref:AMP-binding protein n=1 Tax=Parahaliea mediterranea TaxID=651086 RepID=A0A939IJZ7_9GAMM|nr:AMP-binding protein [Parahaliea mediterranea]MBN7798224.1 AMP-binding protein [Parahaliea mediterranea]
MSQDLQQYHPVDCLYKGLAMDPEAIAAQDENDCLSYRELSAKSEALAAAIAERVPEGGKVAICARNSCDHLCAFLAIVLAGRIWVPMNPRNGREQNAAALARVRPELLLVDSYSAGALDAPGTPTIYLDGAPAGGESMDTVCAPHRGRPFTAARPALDAVMAIKFTGGTTGEPKGVVQTHRNVAAVIASFQDFYQLKARDINLAVAPLTHGASHYVLPILAAGGKHLLSTKVDPDALVAAIRDAGVTVTFMPPTLIYKLIESPLATPEAMRSLRHLTYSAAPMPGEKIAAAQAALGPCISTVYGQTEAPMMISALGPEEMRLDHLRASVGRAAPFASVCIRDAGGRPCEPGAVGEITVRGDIVTPGYFESPDKTAEAIRDGWLYTGDLGYLDEQGYLYICGRSKEVIISGGFNVYPAEVESALMEVDGILECVVVGVADDYWGERVEAVIRAREGSLPLDDLRERIKARVGPVKAPKQYHVWKDIPRNPVGKIVRRDICQLLAQ